MDQAPTTPGAGRRPRTGSRSFSMHSDRSAGKSKDLPQSPGEKAEKERRDSFLRGESKANPNAAVLELQPQARNVMEKVTLDSIRSMPAKDSSGNLITEPDLSNPTRPRWERPLDTIRSFERAIDGDYTRRSHTRAHSEYDRENQYASRRSSYFGGYNGQNPGRYNTGSYYGGRPDNGYDSYGAPPAAPRGRFSRGMSEGGMGRHYNGQQYPQNNASYDGSDSTGPWANSTDPSSQNSSYERLHAMGKAPQNDYGMHDGFGQQAINEDRDDYGFPPRPPQKSYGAPPPAPPHAESARQPIKLGGGGSNNILANQGGQLPSNVRPPQEKEKRQSWLGRRFSKNK